MSAAKGTPAEAVEAAAGPGLRQVGLAPYLSDMLCYAMLYYANSIMLCYATL